MRQYFYDLQGFITEKENIQIGRVGFAKVLLTKDGEEGLSLLGASPFHNMVLMSAIAWASFCSFLRSVFQKDTPSGFKVTVYEVTE